MGDPGYKDGGTAALFSFLITGGGQLYTGEVGAGMIYLLGSVAAIGIGVGATDWGCYDCDYTPAYVGLGVASALWLASIFDAGPSARRQNRKLAAAQQAAIAPLLDAGVDGARVGIRLALRP
jgi:hypothetical protein